MADAKYLPDLLQLALARPGAARPKLARGLGDDSTTDTTIYLSSPLLDEDGSVPTKPFILVVKKLSGANAGAQERIFCPANSIAADGLSIAGVTRGIEPGGLDYNTTNENFVLKFDAEDPVYIAMTGIEANMLISALQGIIATGGLTLQIGDTSTNAVKVQRIDDTGAIKEWLSFDGSNAGFSDDGVTINNFVDAISSVLVKASSSDTTAGYLWATGDLGKVRAGDNVTLSLQGSGGNEYLEISATTQREGVTTHETYTPAFMTGGTAAETSIPLWDSVSDGSFRVTVDGTAYNVDAIDFTDYNGTGSPVSDMSEVAAQIQIELRALTSSSETVVWNTDHFVITSADTTATTEVSVLTTSTGTVGTDISGAGASNWMDSDAGNGTATAGVVDATADAGKVPLLNANGNVDTDLLQEVIPTGGYTAKGELVVASGADTPTLLTPGSDGDLLVADSTATEGLAFKGASELIGLTGSTVLVEREIDSLTTQTTSGGSVTKYGYMWQGSGTTTNDEAGFYETIELAGNDIVTAGVEIKIRKGNSNAIPDATYGFIDGGYLPPTGGTIGSTRHIAFTMEYDVDDKLFVTCGDNSSFTEVDISEHISDFEEWNSIRFEFEDSSEARFYVNGILVETITTNVPSFAGLDTFQMGHDSNLSAQSKVMQYMNKVIYKITHS